MRQAKEPRYREYDPFAWAYNRYWGGYSVNRFCPVVARLVLTEAAAGSRLLDLCCGAGHMSHWLAERGYQVTGLDSSETMLGYARVNAPGCDFVLADARSFRLPERYAAAISMFDSLNHILDPGELTAAFGNVRDALAPGGIFLCDLNTRSKREPTRRGISFVESDHVVVAHTRYDDETRIAQWQVTTFRLAEDSGQWQRAECHLRQRIYDRAEILAAFRAAGFDDVAWYDSKRPPSGIILPGGTAFGRTFFLARSSPRPSPKGEGR